MSRTIKLINTVVKNLAPPSKRTIFWFDGSPAFGLRVTPKGIKSFIFQYKASGVTRMVTMGTYPALSIKEARATYNTLYEAVYIYKRDIVAEKLEALKKENERITIIKLINDYESFSRLKGKKSIEEEIRALNADVVPLIGNKYIENVTSSDINKIQHRIISRATAKASATSNGKVAVRNTLAYTRQLFNFAKNKPALKQSLKDMNWSNPVLEIESLGEKAVRDRVASFRELWLFWNKIEHVGLPPVTAKTLKFILATMQRSNEIKNMTYSALKTDENVWEMARTDTKNGKMHRVPLNSYSRHLIEEVKPYTQGSSFVFGATRKIHPSTPLPDDLKPFTRSALSKALKRKRPAIGIEDITPHDLRRTGATWITAVGLPKLYARLLLNHSDGENDVTGEVYVQYGYDLEKQKAVDVWAFVLDQIVQCATVDDVPTLNEVRIAVQKSGLL